MLNYCFNVLKFVTRQYLNASFLHLFSVWTGVVNYRGFHIKKQQVFHEMSPSKHSCCDSIWELRNENKEYFRGLLQFIVITGDSSKKNQHGKPGQPWRLPHREQFSGHIKESVQAVRIRSLIFIVNTASKLDICSRWGPVWIWPICGYGHDTGLDCLIRGRVYLFRPSPAAFPPCLHRDRATVKGGRLRRTGGTVHMQTNPND